MSSHFTFRHQGSRRGGLLAIALTALMLSGAGNSPSSDKPSQGARSTRPTNPLAPPPAKVAGAGGVAPQAPAPDDQVGGIVSSYVCLRVHGGVIPARLPDGGWTLHRAAANPVDADAPVIDQALLAQDERDLAATLARDGVTSIERFYHFAFKRPDLAQQYGLDRAYLAHVVAGADVRVLAADLTNVPALVERAELDNVGSIAVIPNDTSFNLQWNMHNIGQVVGGQTGTPDADVDAPEAWDLHTGSATTIIAILDTGVQANHPDLNGKVISGIDTYVGGSDTSDLNGHGTHCAGVAAARGNDGIGVAGVNWNAKILAVRVTSSGGSSNQAAVAQGVIYAADNGADVISMSLQFQTDDQNLIDACAYAYDSGTLPVAATGNIPPTPAGTIAAPARYAKCMGVGATTNTDVFASFSAWGPQIDVVAPGNNVYSSWRLSTWQYDSGTSMATPHVAGLAGLIHSRNPALTVPQIEQLIKATAEDKGPAGWDQNYGWGRINLRAAMLLALPSCPADVNHNNTVNVDDLLAVITAWGACPSCPPLHCPADIAPAPLGNCSINVDDLLAVITGWGACP